MSDAAQKVLAYLILAAVIGCGVWAHHQGQEKVIPAVPQNEIGIWRHSPSQDEEPPNYITILNDSFESLGFSGKIYKVTIPNSNKDITRLWVRSSNNQVRDYAISFHGDAVIEVMETMSTGFDDETSQFDLGFYIRVSPPQ